jgi:hypothetical protein
MFATFPPSPSRLSRLYCPQVLYKVYEPAELRPVLEAVNAEQTQEKEKEK